jgi:PAS domain S-box-containing protein
LHFRRLSPEDLITRLAAIVDSSEDAIIGRDENGIINTWNTAATRLFGYSPEEALGQSVLFLIPAELQDEELSSFDRLRRGERIDHYQTQRVRKDGQRVDISVTVSPIPDADQRIIGSALIARDIGPQRREQADLARLAAIVESSDDAIIAKDLNGIITDWNAAAERMFGYTVEEIVGRSVLTIIPPELQHEEPVILSKIRSGERIEHFETRRLRKNGQLFDISLTVSPIKNNSGKIIGASKIVRDISDRKAAEAALVEKEKLAATGRLAAALAHEVNNPLESITNLAYLLVHHQDLDEESRQYASTLLSEVQRAGDITRQTLSYYKSSRASGDVNIVDLLQHILRWKKKKMDSKQIMLQTDFGHGGFVAGVAGELRQVFENLIENAIDATPAHGIIRVRVRTRGPAQEPRVAVSVCDTGHGISQATMKKIFDPFFTTKLHTGSGLGLWVSREILQKHRGTVHARSSEASSRSGSVFTVTLPAAPASAVKQPQKNDAFQVA